MSATAGKRTLSLDKWPVRMRVSQVATYLNCSEFLVISLIRNGQLAATDTRSPGAKSPHYLINREDVAEFERKNTVA